MPLVAVNSSKDIIQLNFLSFGATLLKLPQAIVLHLVPQLITVSLGLVSLMFTENTGKHTVLHISNFALILDSLLTFPEVKFLHLPQDLLLILSKALPALKILVAIVSI